ncbi:MAG: 4-hydroxyacetophenone monooxygenase [Actinomycetota bacterium]|nr:4-hydroxyacetophenone monooxygenase [Actinomycetota bacterium]
MTTRFSAGDDEIRSALGDASVVALLPAVAQLTGDFSILRDDLRPDPTRVIEPEGGLTEAQQDEAREIAFAALQRFRDGEAGGVGRERPTPEELGRLMGFVVSPPNVEEYFDLLREELAVAGEDLRAPGWANDAGHPFTVAIVGAGMSGLLAAYRLQQAGIDFVVFEKNDDVGGTWFENTYPGCRVDVPNHLYSYSFAQGEWAHHFSSQDQLLDYFRAFADEHGLRERIRFGTEVASATWSDETATWTVVTKDGGPREFNAVISAVGQLNRPSYPAIEGLSSFAGPAFHSARWDDSVDLEGKRVAVIGTGASATQLIPEIAPRVGRLTIFQRTPNWLAPTPEYHEELRPGMHWLVHHLPSYGQWYRLWLFWRTHEGLLPAAVVDPEWDRGEESVSAANDLIRQLLTAYFAMEFGDRPDLLAKVVPAYPPIAKRIIRDNGIWSKTLHRDNVELVTGSIERITPTGVVTADGVEHEVDVIVYGTGFTASKFLTPMQVVGRNGVDLHERWAGDARAYLGITVPDFPNLFCLYGPNTNIVINGSIIYFSELEVRYILESIRLLLDGGHRALDCRHDVHDGFNKRIDDANRSMAWGASKVNSWYKNANGRVAQNWPFSLLEYWQQTRRVDAADYELL